MTHNREEYLASPALRSFLGMDMSLKEEDMPGELSAILDVIQRLDFKEGEKIVSEGDEGDSLFIIESGKADVIKESSGGCLINQLQESDVFGELALFTGEKRSATVLAHTDVEAFKLARKDFESLTAGYPQITGTFLKKVYNRLTDSYKEMKILNEQLASSNRIRTELASLFTSIVLVITAYTFVISILNSSFLNTYEHAATVKFISSRLIELVTLTIVIRIILKSNQPARNFGITPEGWKKHAIEAIWVSAAVVAFLCIFKWISIRYDMGIFKDRHIISLSYFDWSYITYLAIAPLQEFIARGVIQSSLQRLLVGSRSGFWAVLITSFLFGSLHLFTSQNLAIAAVITSWLWGWMFARQKSLTGVSLSHFIIGNMAGLLGFWTIF